MSALASGRLGGVAFRFLVAVVAVLAGTGARGAETFEAVCERLRTGDNLYFSDRLALETTAQLETGGGDVATRAGWKGILARERLKLGDPAAAIELLDEALAEVSATSAPEGGLVSSLEWHLALAWIQLAEDQNCIGHHNAASCLLPVTKEGIHTRPEAARRAGDVLADYAGRHPRNVQAAWLLNVVRQVSGDWPDGVPENLRLPAGALANDAQLDRWRDRAPELGLAEVDLAGGAVMDDFDGDGHLDLLATTWDPCDAMKAYRNDGRGGFENVTEAWGLSGQLGGLNLVQADYDDDGMLDLLVLRGAWLLSEGRIRNSLLHNQLDTQVGQFVDVTRAAGMAEPAFASGTAAWADYDADGDLDVYVGNEWTFLHAFPNQLFRNEGDGRFREVAAAAGVTNNRYTKAVTWGDYDNDGDPDLYVSNIGENRLYRNDGGGRFVDVAPELEVTAPVRESFPAWFFDYDNDSDLDIFVADYRQQPARVSGSYFGLSFDDGQPLLYRNDGGRFTEVSAEVGLERPLMPMGANYGDLDNDGWLDIYLGTGEPDLASLMPNVMYRNTAGRFVDVSFVGGFAHIQKGHGVAFGDVDNDGDQDLFHQLGGFYPGDTYANSLFENPGGGGNWVTLRLEGARANSFGVGARIELEVSGPGGNRSFHALVGGGGSFGGSSLQQELGIGEASSIERLTVRWPAPGPTQVFADVAANHVYRVVEGSSELVAVSVAELSLGGEH
ncbi:MAG: CRTAC1 family protein [Acidobacteriota bacterium]|nr:CRTAC1 family protein [Acidobacteriota bacterium]